MFDFQLAISTPTFEAGSKSLDSLSIHHRKLSPRMTSKEIHSSGLIPQEQRQQQKMEAYYSFQSKIYDATRWSFLFGRKTLIGKLPNLPDDAVIMEIGCGTGFNLKHLVKKYPKAHIFGLDASSIMLEKAKRKLGAYGNIKILHETYGTPSEKRPKKADLILFSYSLSMINPQWSALIECAHGDLKEDGIIAVTDFEYSRFGWFSRHMANHHVRMEKHLVPKLEQHFKVDLQQSKAAYGGVWNYLFFVGKK